MYLHLCVLSRYQHKMYKIPLIFALVLFGSSTNAGLPRGFLSTKLHPDTGLTPEQIIKKYGYPFENHTVQTSDGYLLTLHRIPYGIKNNNTKTIRPVLIMHGLLSSSADFINKGPDKAISFLLADAGYDVWLGNYRGNKFSRKHINIDPDKENTKFYNFSVDELGLIDLPTKIDYILNITKQKQLFYIGHSMGATSILMLLSTNLEYNDKIKMVTTLAPIVYLKDNNTPSIVMGHIVYILVKKIAKSSISFEFLPSNSLIQPILRIICTIPILRELCAFGIFFVNGFDSDELDRDFLPVIFTNFPSEASFNHLMHFQQIKESDKFQHYNYGSKKNLEIYGQIQPPLYNLSKITTPVIIHYSQNDYFGTLRNFKRIAEEIPNAEMKRVALSTFNHVDFLWAIDVVELVNNKVVDDIKSFT